MTRVAVLLACLLPLAGGCFFSREPASLQSDDPGAKIPAIKSAARDHHSATAKDLVKNLDSDDPAVRFYTIRALGDLTGETFGYIWYADDEARASGLAKWKQWLDSDQGRAELSP